MGLKEKLDDDLKTAMREKDVLRLSVIRMLKSAVKYREIEVGKALEDAEVVKLIGTEIKRRRDSIEQYKAGKTTMIGFFVGQVMKASKGQANPAMVNELLMNKLEG